MKKNKKILAMLMAVVMLFCFNTTVFADSGIPAGVEKHTITLEVPAADSSDGTPGIQPRMWDQGQWPVGIGNTTYTAKFYVEHQHFAYEMSAIPVNNIATSEIYQVDLCYQMPISSLNSASEKADGSVKKNDWIQVQSGREYLFRIINTTNTDLNVKLVYYSW